MLFLKLPWKAADWGSLIPRKISRIISRFTERSCNSVRKWKARHLHKVLVNNNDDKALPISVTIQTIGKLVFEAESPKLSDLFSNALEDANVAIWWSRENNEAFFRRINRRDFLAGEVFKFDRSIFIYPLFNWYLFMYSSCVRHEYINLYSRHAFELVKFACIFQIRG